MAITRYGTITADSATNVNTTRTVSHTVETGTDRLLIFIFGIEDGSAVPSQPPVFNGVAMTLAQTIVSGSTRSYLYYLVAPDAVTADISITFTNNCDDFCCIAANFSGVDQTTPLGNSTAQTDGTSPYDISLTVGAGSLLVSNCCISSGGALPIVPASGLTELGAVRDGTAGTNISVFGGYLIADTAGTYPCGCSAAVSTTGTQVAAEFLPAAAGSNATAEPGGIAAGASVGSGLPVTNATITVPGVVATSAAGSPAAASVLPHELTGVAGAASAGNAETAINGAAEPAGISAAVQAGSTGAVLGAAAAVAGVGAVIVAGGAEIGPEGVVLLLGNPATGVVGASAVETLVASAVTGVVAAGSSGTVLGSALVAQVVSGLPAAGSIGWILPRFDLDVPLAPAVLVIECGAVRIRGSGWSTTSSDPAEWMEAVDPGEDWAAVERAERSWSPGLGTISDWGQRPGANGGWTP